MYAKLFKYLFSANVVNFLLKYRRLRLIFQRLDFSKIKLIFTFILNSTI